MSALRTFLVEVIGLDKPKALNLKSRGLQNPPQNGNGAGGDMKQTVATLDADTESAALKSKVMERLADLVGPFKKAVAEQGPDAPQLQSQLGKVKAHLVKKQFTQAAESLALLEEMLTEQTIPPSGVETEASADSPKNFEVEVFVVNNTKVRLNLLPPHEIAEGAPVINLEKLIQPGGTDGCKISDVSNVKASHKIKGNIRYVPQGTEARWFIHYEFTPDEKDGTWTTEQLVEGSKDFDFEKPDITGKKITYALKQNEVVPPPPPVPRTPEEISTNCLITIKNDTKVAIKIAGNPTNERGDFQTAPPDTVAAGASAQFAYVQTPKETEANKLGCKGSVTYATVSPTPVTWRCEWENLVAEKNSAQASLVPQSGGFESIAFPGQGDENVPMIFTITGGPVAPTPPPKPGQPPSAYAPPSPGYGTESPAYPPKAPAYPLSPEYAPDVPGYPPVPSAPPEPSAYAPQQPDYAPQQPAYPQQPQGYPPQPPEEYAPQQPGYAPQQPAYPQQPQGYPPQAPGYPPQQPQSQHGHDVSWTQNTLIKLGYKPGQPDGKWGPKTKAAVQEFQRSNGLKDDGVVGRLTTAALEQALGGNSAQGPGYQPQQPGYAPQQPGYAPQQPAYPPQGPGYQPQQPGYPPQQPGYQPQQPSYPPQGPGYQPKQPGYPPRQPGYPPQEPGYPEQPGYQPPGNYQPTGYQPPAGYQPGYEAPPGYQPPPPSYQPPPQQQTWSQPGETPTNAQQGYTQDDSLRGKAKELLEEGKKLLED
jgi:hypothetical protein